MTESIPRTPTFSDASVPAYARGGDRRGLGPVDPVSLAARARRIALLLLGVWAMNVFDFGFTWMAHAQGDFKELNPVVAPLLGSSWTLVALYKAGMTMLGTLILITLRRHSVAELACWFLLTAYAYVALRWYIFFDASTAEPATLFGDMLF